MTADSHSHQAECPPPPHDHHHDLSDASGPRLLIVIALNFIIPVAQVIGGILSNSIALISDAVHNFSDFIAVFISYIALRMGRKGASVRQTFGYQRTEIIAAMLNVGILVAAVVFIVYEAVVRFYHPEPVSGELVMVMAGVGVIGNGFSTFLLFRDAKHSLNIKGAFLHMLGDFFTSVLVLVNGAVLTFRPWYWLDPLLSFFIALFILKNCWAVITEAVSILMNATPKGLDLTAVQAYLESQPEIESAHYLHAWRLGNQGVAFSCHLTVSDRMISDTEALAARIRHDLFHQFGIDHPVLQFETVTCGNGTILCELSATEQGDPAMDGSSGSSTGNNQLKLHKILSVITRLILGGVFILAGVPKIIYPAAFAEAVYNYRILPDIFVNIVAIVLPWVEVIVGGLLVVGVWMEGAVLLYNFMMLCFIGALSFNLYRGLDINCGCFSQGGGDAINAGTILRDIFILCMSAYLFYAVYFKKAAAGEDQKA